MFGFNELQLDLLVRLDVVLHLIVAEDGMLAHDAARYFVVFIENLQGSLVSLEGKRSTVALRFNARGRRGLEVLRSEGAALPALDVEEAGE